MQLHNRQIKATFWNDPDMLQWPRDERWFYEGLTQLADDSGCVEDSPFAFKLNLFPSPMDSDITIDVLTAWRDSLIARHKVVPYEAGGKHCLYIMKFHKHQTLKNPQKPEVPLPSWVSWEPFEKNPRSGKYVISDDVLTDFLHQSDDVLLIEVNRIESNLIQEKDESLIQSANKEVAVTIEVQKDSSSSEVSKLCTMYQTNNFGQGSVIVQQKIEALNEEYGFEWVSQAFEESVERGKRTLTYVQSILQNWRAEGGVKRGSDKKPMYRGPTRMDKSDAAANDSRYANFYSLMGGANDAGNDTG